MSIKAMNAKNQFPGKIRHLMEGPVVSEIEVDSAGRIITAAITTSSLKLSRLQVGQEVLAAVKATGVPLATFQPDITCRHDDPLRHPLIA